MSKHKGYTLIEIIIVIVILGIIGVTILKTFDVSLSGSTALDNSRMALDLAKRRMDVILGQARLLGFSSYNDPCTTSPSLPVCTTPTGFTVSSGIVTSWQGNTNFNVVTVTVSGQGQAQLKSLVANY